MLALVRRRGRWFGWDDVTTNKSRRFHCFVLAWRRPRGLVVMRRREPPRRVGKYATRIGDGIGARWASARD